MGIADTAKSLGISVEQFFEWSYQRAGHIYPNAPKPEQAFRSYKYYGLLPAYVISMRSSLKRAETFKRIRERYQQAPH